MGVIYTSNLVFGLYRGLSATLLWRSFFWVLWGSYEVYSQNLKAIGMPAHIVPFFAGGLAANTFWTVSFPFDVIKNRMMTRSALNPPFTNIKSCIEFIVRTEGLSGFYRGFLPAFLRSFPTNASAIFVYETIFSASKKHIRFDIC